MPVRLSDFEMPKRIVKDEASATPTFGRYIAEPFEIGYARTIGNSLRRVLLSSIEGVAITAVKLEGAPHEFCALKGVVEDVTDIILNLKQVKIKSFTRKTRWLEIRRKGPGVVTAADLQVDNSVEILNPTQEIATLGEGATFDLSVQIRVGRGFCPADRRTEEANEVGVIPLDAVFSPVARVHFEIENTRVGQRTDYEKLELDLLTDGRISPDEALKTAAAIAQRHMDVFVELNEQEAEYEEEAQQEEEDVDRIKRILNMSVNEIELSVRAANCLNNANITTVGELALKSEAEMLKYRNFGKKSLKEIKDKLVELGLHFGYEFDPELLDTPIASTES